MQELEDTSIKRFISKQDDSVILQMTTLTMAFRENNVPKVWTLDEIHMMADLGKQMVRLEKERV